MRYRFPSRDVLEDELLNRMFAGAVLGVNPDVRERPTMKVWLVCVGHYSDMTPAAIFSSKEEAKRITKLTEHASLYGPFDIDSVKQPEITGDRQWYTVVINYHGFVLSCQKREPLDYINMGGYQSESEACLPDKIVPRTAKHWLQTYDKNWRGGGDITYWRLHVICLASDEKHAAKIANELRREVIAGMKPEISK